MAQSSDLLYVERLGIPGRVSAQEIADLNIPYVNTRTDESTFNIDRTFFNQFESGENWIIKRSVLDENGNVVNTRAAGVNDAATAWANRLNLTYL